MRKKKMIAKITIIVIAILTCIFIFVEVKPNTKNAKVELGLNFVSDKAMELQLFYKDDIEFSEELSSKYAYDIPDSMVNITMPIDDATSKFLRLDLGDVASNTTINSMSIVVNGVEIGLDMNRLVNAYDTKNIDSIVWNEGKVEISSQDIDPWFIISIEDIDMEREYVNASQTRYLIYHILMCIVVGIVAIICLCNIESIFRVPLDIYRDRHMFWDLVKNDFQAKFAGSYFGIFWAFVQPFITVVLYWFVFQVGLRSGNVSNYPFILFLMSGLVPWFYFSEAFNGASSSLLEYNYLVKKVVFNVGILPVLKIASSIFVHLFFVGFVLIICAIYGYTPDLYCLQLVYYIVCMAFMTLGLSYITSACTVFFKDMTQIVNILLSIGVWLTPIMWNPEGVLSEQLIKVFQLNPCYYIVDGFRDALLAKNWFWEKPVWTIYFWVFSILVYLVGVKMFNKLKVHFSDVL